MSSASACLVPRAGGKEAMLCELEEQISCSGCRESQGCTSYLTTPSLQLLQLAQRSQHSGLLLLLCTPPVSKLQLGSCPGG